MMNAIRVSELTVDELRALIREAVHDAMAEANAPELDQRAILDIPSLSVDPRHPALKILSREDMYGDDGR